MRHITAQARRAKIDGQTLPAAEEFDRLDQEIQTLCIQQRLRDFTDKIMKYWQAFRAGIEGTISALKRAFRLFRFFFKGFRGYARGVGLTIFHPQPPGVGSSARAITN
jgi:hypothetical protein